jgi:hypothetical protein
MSDRDAHAVEMSVVEVLSNPWAAWLVDVDVKVHFRIRQWQRFRSEGLAPMARPPRELLVAIQPRVALAGDGRRRLGRAQEVLAQAIVHAA